MAEPEDRQKDLAAFQSAPLEDLTIQDALIISALYALEGDPQKCKQVPARAQKHPLFVEKAEETTARVNKFVNLMQVNQPLKAVEAAVRSLRPEHRIQAFDFAVDAVLAVKDLTAKKQEILKTLAAKMELENEVIERRLEKIRREVDQ